MFLDSRFFVWLLSICCENISAVVSGVGEQSQIAPEDGRNCRPKHVQ